MIIYIVGVPGAGKTYYAVDKIFNYLKDDTYQSIYTNINKFDFDFSQRLHKFDYEEFYQNIKDLYYIYKDKNTTDYDLIQRVKYFGYYKALFVIDEAHNFFDTPDTIINWLFSYHRHLFFDFFLITQNLALIDTKYKKFAEYFIRAVPTSLQLFSNTFKYKKFIDSRMSQKSMAGVENIKKSPEIFDLYHSGDSVKAPNIIKKYFIYFFVGLFFTFLLFKFVVSFISPNSNNTEQKIKSSIDNNISKSSKSFSKLNKFLGIRGSLRKNVSYSDNRDVLSDEIDIVDNSKSLKYYYIDCIDTSCKFKNINFSFSSSSISSLIREFKCKKVFKNSDSFVTSYLLKCKNMKSFLLQFEDKKDYKKLGGNYAEKGYTNPITSSFLNRK